MYFSVFRDQKLDYNPKVLNASIGNVTEYAMNFEIHNVTNQSCSINWNHMIITWLITWLITVKMSKFS